MTPKVSGTEILLQLFTIDFGMSRILEGENSYQRTREGLGPVVTVWEINKLNKQRWMSPESLLHKKYSPYTDIWSIGALMIELVTRDKPWTQLDNMDIIQMVAYQGQIPPLPQEIHPVMLKAIQVSL